MELGIPWVLMAVNMMDLVNKNGDKIDMGTAFRTAGLARVVEISALKGTGVKEAAEESGAPGPGQKDQRRGTYL